MPSKVLSFTGKDWAASDRDDLSESLTAQLTLAAYAVVLRSGRPASWLDLELDLWKALSETVGSCEQIRAASPHSTQELEGSLHGRSSLDGVG
jgi:hypothetical protein